MCILPLFHIVSSSEFSPLPFPYFLQPKWWGNLHCLCTLNFREWLVTSWPQKCSLVHPCFNLLLSLWVHWLQFRWVNDINTKIVINNMYVFSVFSTQEVGILTSSAVYLWQWEWEWECTWEGMHHSRELAGGCGGQLLPQDAPLCSDQSDQISDKVVLLCSNHNFR